MAALVAVSARPDGPEVLGVGPSLAAQMQANIRLRELPTRTVADLYTGVLYEALDLASLPAAARRAAARQIVVVSALWGALRPTDAVPPYRLSMSTDLPGVGPLAAHWRRHLDAPLTQAAGMGLVVDCRSSTYQSAWVPSAELAARTVAVRVLREQGGRRSVVSHLAKRTRGQVARHLLLRGGRAPRTPRLLATAVAERFPCELSEPVHRGRPWTLDVVVRGNG